MKLGIKAPSEVKVYRREVYAAIQEENRAAAAAAPGVLPKLDADPKNYQPYNVLAAFLEQHGQKEQALKLYKKSMEIEWNQPPTGEAIHRLEKELNK